MNIQQLAPQLASTCCVINGAFMTLEDVEKMGYDEFLYRSKINMPLRLYKYFSNAENDKEGSKVNYSMIAYYGMGKSRIYGLLVRRTS